MSLFHSLNSWYARRSALHRAKRHEHFCAFVSGKPVNALLDVGGTPDYWKAHPFPGNAHIALLNPSAKPEWNYMGHSFIKGPSEALEQFASDSYDLVFSNSTLAYVGGPAQRARCAANIRRIGLRYYVQTPNYLFPIDWHTLVPFFHWVPKKWQAWLICRMRVGRLERRKSYADALAYLNQSDEVTYSELRRLFPDGTIVRERVLGVFTKSFTVHSP